MTTQQKIKVLVVDDHPLARAGIGAIIGYQDDCELVGNAANGSEAVKLFTSCCPDVVLVDLSLPDMTGIELIEILSSKSSTARFLVLTANIGGSEIAKAMRAGAHAYLFKEVPSEELVGAIRAVARDGSYLSAAVARKADEAAEPGLTARELEVLALLVRGLSNGQISAAIGVTEDTVKYHVRNILSKLGVRSRSKAVAESLRLGLM